MQVQRRSVALAAAIVSLIAAAPASAGIWTPVSSGTTNTITAIDYQAPGALYYTTSGGQILKNGVVQSTFPGVSFNDIAFNPSGTVGLAAGSNGKLYRSNAGGPWTAVNLANSTFTDTNPCGSAGPTASATRNAGPTGNLNAVAWASDSVAYVVASDQGVVLKSTDNGATFLDRSRQADSTCWVDTNGDILTDVKTIPGSDIVWFLSDGFGTRFISANGLTSSTARQGSTSANCFDHAPAAGARPRQRQPLVRDRPLQRHAADRLQRGQRRQLRDQPRVRRRRRQLADRPQRRGDRAAARRWRSATAARC